MTELRATEWKKRSGERSGERCHIGTAIHKRTRPYSSILTSHPLLPVAGQNIKRLFVPVAGLVVVSLPVSHSRVRREWRCECESCVHICLKETKRESPRRPLIPGVKAPLDTGDLIWSLAVIREFRCTLHLCPPTSLCLTPWHAYTKLHPLGFRRWTTPALLPCLPCFFIVCACFCSMLYSSQLLAIYLSGTGGTGCTCRHEHVKSLKLGIPLKMPPSPFSLLASR